MNKFKVIFTAEKIYFADDLDKAQEIAENDLNRMANPLKAQVFSVSPHTAQHNWESVGIYPLEVSEEEWVIKYLKKQWS